MWVSSLMDLSFSPARFNITSSVAGAAVADVASITSPFEELVSSLGRTAVCSTDFDPRGLRVCVVFVAILSNYFGSQRSVYQHFVRFIDFLARLRVEACLEIISGENRSDCM